MSKIAKLRELSGFDGYWGYYAPDEDREKVELIDDILYEIGEQVDSSFQEGGRWSNYEYTTHKVEENGETAYFEICREVPATESQEGGDHMYEFYEVEPKQVTTTKYYRV
jgi:hypothetical protein